MGINNYRKYGYYFISVFFLFTGLFGINRLITKADLPFVYTYQNYKIISGEHYDGINPGDTILAVDGINIVSIYQLESVTDGMSVGDDTRLEVSSKSNKIKSYEIHLSRYYRNLYFILISLLVGLSFWITSVFLIFKKYGQNSVTALFWVLILFSAATLTTPGKYFPGSDWIAYLVRSVHVTSYFLGAVVFFHFTFIFPGIRNGKYRFFIPLLYSLSALFSVVLVISVLNSISDINSGWVLIMENLWIVTESVLLILIISGALNLYLHYRKIKVAADRKKIEWIFWGLLVGAGPFLLLWLFPRLMGFNELIPEEFLLAFLILVPVFFALAVVKYHVFDIDVFIKKSLLYSALTFITVIIYFVAVTLITLFAGDLMKEYGNVLIISLILLIAYIFNPLQIRLRNLIDRLFYKETYNFENTVAGFAAGIKEQNTISGLSSYVISEIEKIIPVSRSAIVSVTEDGEKLRILSQNNFDELKMYISALRLTQISTDLNNIIAQKEKVDPEIYTDNRMTGVLKGWGINLVIPFMPESANNTGAILLGDKLSGLRYSKRDIDLLNVLVSNVSLAYKKLQLQEKLVLEELEISRLEEINKMMAYYVSSVSHDLKTPLTSIKMFTEILKEQRNKADAKAEEYLNIIEGESDRLSRLINNVLNYAKIENGIKEYSFSKINLNECLEDVLRIMEYQLAIDKFKVEKSFAGNICIYADKDAVKEILINLISNSVKYSPGKKTLRVSSGTDRNYAFVKIEDEGIGIRPDEIDKIFKPFMRSRNSHVRHTGGAGIGLSIVKNIMDAHNGRIEVESSPGKGTVFTLYFKHGQELHL
ncbi:MAG: hypothetical protein JNJ56_06235 [Ignavibacteria bacterium]|nr:hypothetical protein [Ignavibacteria bacterium]